ncbi:MAG: toxin-antitoxin system HicB family antitoxin [Ottowia sp.]|uniref:toxin-antitoxin system HicB family antitoxin n=1 Tax=Ottowia sp. TaxID=1898956 RepID=UPI003C71D3C5
MAQDDYIRTALRVPPELHQALHEAADKSSKSFNAEIIERLSRTFKDEETLSLMRANMALLRMLADYVTLRAAHPQVTDFLQEPILKMARTIQEMEGEGDLLEATKEPLVEYVKKLTGAVDKVTEILGEGWAKDLPGKPRKHKPTPDES